MERALFVRRDTAHRIAEAQERKNPRITSAVFIHTVKHRGEIKGYAIQTRVNGEYAFITENEVEQLT